MSVPVLPAQCWGERFEWNERSEPVSFGWESTGLCRVACVVEGGTPASLLYCRLFLCFLSLIASSRFCFSSSVQSFILYHKLCFLCFVSTHAHTSKHLPPPPSCLWITVLAQTGTCTYIKSSSPPPFLCVRACMRVLQKSWEVPLARLACARSLGAFLSLSLSLALAVWRLEVCSCKAGHLSPTKKTETQKICHK